jgi:hypothetical protein
VLLTKTRLKEKLAKLEEEVKRLAAIEKALLASPDKQISLTDPDCRSMATSGRGSGMVAYTKASPTSRSDPRSTNASAACRGDDLRAQKRF